MASINSTGMRLVVCTAVCGLSLLSSEAVAQQSISPGCQLLQNSQQFPLAHGFTTGKYPSEEGIYFYQGDKIGATWTQGVKMKFQVWQIGTPEVGDRVVGFLENNQGKVSLLLNLPSNYYAVELINTDPDNNDFAKWTCTPKPAPKINQTHNFNATVSLTLIDTQRNVTGQLSGVLFIDGGGNLVSTALTLNMPYSGQSGITSTSSCDFQSGSNDSTRTLFIFDSADCLTYNSSPNGFGVRVYIQTSAPLTSTSAQLTGASFFGNHGVGGEDTGGSIVATSSLTGSHDFNDDSKSDIVWSTTALGAAAKPDFPQAASTTVAAWLMNGGQPLSAGVIANVPANWSIIGQRDFTGHGNADFLWRDTSGNLALWFMHGLRVLSTASLGNVPTNWRIFGTGDLNGDGIGDLLWRDSNSGAVAIWFMGANGISSTATLAVVPNSWAIIGNDNKGGIFWRDSAGNIAVWQVKGSQVTKSASLGNLTSTWMIAGFGDFNGDGNTDLLFRETNSGAVAIWFLNNNATVQSAASVTTVGTTWRVAQTGDYNGDGYSDMLWTDASGNVAIWFMRGAAIASAVGLGNVGTSWTALAANSE